MEPDAVYAGCRPCAVAFPGGDERDWSKERGWFDRHDEAHKQAADAWNKRHNAGAQAQAAKQNVACSGLLGGEMNGEGE